MLVSLANKYENKEFLVGDPSWFMHQIEGDTNRELLAFIASSVSYGSRKQFLPKIQMLLDGINDFGYRNSTDPNLGSKNNTDSKFEHNKETLPYSIVSEWLTSHSFESVVPHNSDCFYRLYTNATYYDFLSALAEMVREYGSIKQYLVSNLKGNTCLEAIGLLTDWFRCHNSIGVIPKDTTSSCKRVCMFLRWMVRDNSPVDLGLWSDIIDKRTLIIPMDTHVVQEALRLGLLNSKSVSMSAAIKLSNRLAETFPDDPIKGDFALFGLGIDNAEK